MKRPATSYLLAFAVVLGAMAVALASFRRETAPPPTASSAAAIEAPPTPQTMPPLSPAVDVPIGRISQFVDSPLPSTIPLQTGQLPWERDIAAIEAQKATEPVKARLLLGLLSKAPPEAWQTITEAALTRVANDDYPIQALPLLANPQTNGMILSVLFQDIAERPEAVSLPAWLEVARMPNHPLAEPARQNLAHTIGRDLGRDWAGWRSAVQQRLLQRAAQ